MSITAYAASIGHSVWFSHDRGENWLRKPTPTGGMYNECRCWCVETHPDRPGEVLAGTDQGLYRWTPAEDRFRHIPSPLDNLQIMQLAQAPHDPDIIVAGTRPADIYLSRDGGETWFLCPLPNSNEADFINTPRVTSIHFDPWHRAGLWVTIEIDGVFYSGDGGETWEKRSDGLISIDTHNLVFLDRPEGRQILCSTEEGLHRSLDHGKTWQHEEVPQAPYVYFRCMKKREDDSGVILLSVGDRPSGRDGLLFRSRDYGDTWAQVDLPADTNTTIWWISTSPVDPMLIFFCTIFGQIWRSQDGGETWQKMEQELGELRMIAFAETGAETGNG